MKKVRNTLIALMTVLTVNSFATIHTVIFGTSTNVICFTGDTVRFKDMSFQPTLVSILTPGGPVIITSPLYTTPDGSGKIIDYVITGNETAYQMNHSAASSSGTITVQTTTGINGISNNNLNIKVFPNPFMDVLSICSFVKTTMNIFNVNGGLVLTTKIEKGENKIDVSSLPSGIYFVIVGKTSTRVLKP